jgi:hypothetical protein
MLTVLRHAPNFQIVWDPPAIARKSFRQADLALRLVSTDRSVILQRRLNYP